MKYEAIDRWNTSSYLSHYGVKGMKWGVRKSVERSGRVVRKMGGAVKNSATRIAGGLVRAGSAVRRFKNRRAIKSGDSARIAKRVNKMSNQELTDAVTRAHLVSQLHNGNNSNSISLGDTVANSLKRKAGDMAANALQTTVTSALRGESPLSTMVRNARAEKVQQEQQISNNKLQTISNNYRIGNSALQNQADIAKLNMQIASSNDKVQSLIKSQAPISSIQQTYTMPYGRRYVRRKLSSSNTYRYALYHDDMRVNDFLAHYGVLGMKWGVRKTELQGRSYQYRSIGQKMKQRKVNNLKTTLEKTSNSDKQLSIKNKLRKQERKLNTLKTRDKKREQYAKSASIGGAAARTFLFGMIGNGTYERMRSAGASKVDAGATMVAGMLFSPIGAAAVSKVFENYKAHKDNIYKKSTDFKSINKEANKEFKKDPNLMAYEYAVIDGKPFYAKDAFDVSLNDMSRREYLRKVRNGTFNWKHVVRHDDVNKYVSNYVRKL